MTTLDSLWANSLAIPLDKDSLRQRAQYFPPSILHPQSMSTGVLMEAIERCINETYVATDQHLRLLEQLVLCVQGHYTTAYSSEVAYHSRIQQKCSSPNALKLDRPALLITGLAGCGKSELLKTLVSRVLPPKLLHLTQQVAEVPTYPALRLEVACHSAEKELVRGMLHALDGIWRPGKASISKLQDELLRKLYTHGNGMLIVDELQFLVSAAGSISKAMRLLINLLTLGSPVVYCANYSLIHAIQTRPQQERQRLLSSVIEVFPERPESDDWLSIVAAMKNVAPDIFCFDPKEMAEELHRMTAGLNRLLKQLLISALKLALRNKTPRITPKNLKEAYHSADYSQNKSDVEKIVRIAIEPSYGKTCKDMWSPFPRSDAQQAYFDSFRVARRQNISQIAAMSCQPISVQQEYQSRILNKPKAAVSKHKRPSRVTTQNLAENLRGMLEYLPQKGHI